MIGMCRGEMKRNKYDFGFFKEHRRTEKESSQDTSRSSTSTLYL
jgi:hypothetical protein